MSFTKKHYEIVAAAILAERDAANAKHKPITRYGLEVASPINGAVQAVLDSLVTRLSRIFEGDNPNFDPQRFADAAWGVYTPTSRK